MCARVVKALFGVVTLAVVVSVPVTLVAQDAPKPAPKAYVADSASKWDIFVGYSYLQPYGKIGSAPATGLGRTYGNIVLGSTESVTRYFDRHVGLQVEGNEHVVPEKWPYTSTLTGIDANDDFAGVAAGPIVRFPKGNFTPFVHTLIGTERVGSIWQPDAWGLSATLGGGLDLETPWFDHHLAIRLFQLDYEYAHPNSDNINSIVGSIGVVYHIGTMLPPPPVTLSLAVSPASVFAGEPVTATATPGSLDPKLNAVYLWDGPGVKGSGTTAAIDTAALAPGTYTVKASIKEGKPGKEGLKPGQTADASGSFTVKAWEPPTISCSVAPTTIKPGETSTVSASAVSPQNRPLTYTYSASAGMVSGTGNTATFSSTGAPTGTVSITCNVADDKDHSATATTNVTILAPYVPPVLHSEELSPLAFEAGKNEQSSARVNNEVKAILDGVALTLQKQPDAKVVIVGESTAAEKAAAEKLAKRSHKKGAKAEDLAAQRAVNTKDYLAKEKGIDPSRISVAEGTKDEQKVEIYLVPAGANFSADVHDVTPVDESVVKPQVRKAMPAAHHHAKKAM
jgi:hypothetical protein